MSMLLVVLAVVLGGAALYFAVSPRPLVQGAGAVDAQGRPAVKPPAPDQQGDALGVAIANTVAEGFKIASLWLNQSNAKA